jgi:purine-binding chemotaxis protein CheW
MSEKDRIAQLQEEITRRAARPEETQEEEEAFLIFLLAEERFAFPLSVVREISRLRPITPLPGLPDTVLGAAGLRGEVLAIIDLRRMLALPESPATDDSRLLIVQHENVVAALLADQVQDIATLPRAALASPPAGEAMPFLQGIAHQGKQTTRLLDLARLVEAVRHGK